MKNFVSIITVSYNGKKYLEDFLESAFHINYPNDKYEVVVVDNGSTDGSVEFVREKYPRAKVIESDKNLGFARGNNLGIKNSKGDFFFLVNNDTFLHPDCVISSISTFHRWAKKIKVAAVNSKLVLVDKYLPFIIKEAFFSDCDLPVKVNGLSDHTFVSSNETTSEFLEKIFVPVRDGFSDGLNTKIKIKPFRKNEFQILFAGKVIFRGFLKSLSKEVSVSVKLTRPEINSGLVDLIQNAGNFYFRDGHGRDRGSLVIKQRQFYEADLGQYQTEEIIPGFCGAGTLINKEALNEVGYFDEKFFMYYEDSDLSFRFREAGWNIVYSPNSLIRHIHAGSSKEWSKFFIYNAERGRLIFLFKHWPRFMAIWQWLKYIVLNTLIVPLYKRNADLFTLRLKANLSVVFPFILGMFSLKKMSRLQYEDLL